MFLYSSWLSLPLSTRVKIADQFKIIKKGSTEVFNDTIKSDGYLIKDIETLIDVPTLQDYLNTEETDMGLLWEWMVDKVEGKQIKQGATSILSKGEVLRMNKEYEVRTGKTAPIPEIMPEKEIEESNVDQIIKSVNN